MLLSGSTVLCSRAHATVHIALVLWQACACLGPQCQPTVPLAGFSVQPRGAVQCRTVQYSIVQYSTVQYSTGLQMVHVLELVVCAALTSPAPAGHLFRAAAVNTHPPVLHAWAHRQAMR
jgi:hypothetical protein